MGLYEASKSRTHLTAPIDGQTVAVWLEDKSAGPAVYAQPYQFATNPAGTSSMVEVQGMTIFPNPAAQVLHWCWPAGQRAGIRVTVFDAMGREVDAPWREGSGETVGGTLEVATWSEGLYQLQLVSSDGSGVIRMSFMVVH